MRVPLYVRSPFGQPMPFLSFSLRSRRYRLRPAIVEALVDTGSSWVALAPKDAKLLNVPFSALRRATDYPEIAFAGFKFWRLLLEDVDILVRDETGLVVEAVHMPSITVLQPTKRAPPKLVEQVYSVLGIDFLVAGKFSLHFDPIKGGFLERSD